jgi:hypothetical protein
MVSAAKDAIVIGKLSIMNEESPRTDPIKKLMKLCLDQTQKIIGSNS